MKTQYVVGFYFMGGDTSVVLIRKNKPGWQAGKLNGVGGKIEPGESPTEAMIREFAEEAAKQTCAEDWRLFALLQRSECDVCFFESSGTVEGIRSQTDEKLEVCLISDGIPADALSNLRWLIPLALNNEPCVAII